MQDELQYLRGESLPQRFLSSFPTTFRYLLTQEYASHLHREAHNSAMQQLKQHLQLTLGRMRTKQKTQQESRDSQLKLQEVDSGKTSTASFCKVTRLGTARKL